MFFRKVGIFLLFVALVYGIGAFGSYMTNLTLLNWYQTLPTPSWSPPNWLFGPVWMLLYFLIALVGFLLWKNREQPGVSSLFPLYWMQLICNGIWSFLFFALKQPLAAAIDILLMVFLVSLFMAKAWRVKKNLTVLFFPYLLWILYAGAINWYIVLH